MEDRKRKKPTKKEMIEAIPKVVEQELNKNYIKNMTQGFELANRMILDYINAGHGIDDVKGFIEKNLSVKGIEAMDKVTQK